MSRAFEWYLIRTKAGEERRANEYLSRFVDEAFLPLVKVRLHRWGKLVGSIAPLFTCYLFAMFDLERERGRHQPRSYPTRD
jgi:Transcription termination factor nusG